MIFGLVPEQEENTFVLATTDACHFVWISRIQYGFLEGIQPDPICIQICFKWKNHYKICFLVFHRTSVKSNDTLTVKHKYF